MPIIRDLLAASTRGIRNLPALTGTHSSASVNVTPERALQVATVYASVRILSESIAAMPAGLYRRTPDYRTRVEEHPLKKLLIVSPNPVIDAGEYWRTVMGWMLLRGNAIVFVQRNNAGAPIALWPVSPANVEIKRFSDGTLRYVLGVDGLTEYLPVKRGYIARPEEILHYRAFGLGVEGLSPIGMARQQIGTSFAASSYIGGFFARDASPGGIVSVDGKLDDKQYDRLTEQWKSLHEGFDNSHKLAVMEGGAKWEKTTLSPADAQFLDVYKLTRQEIAAIYGVPPHMVGDLDRATFSNIEQQSLEFVMHSLRPWLVRLEKVTQRLFTEDDMYLKFNVDGLLRGDISARYEAYAKGRQWGFLSGNDVRKKEDEDPIEGLDEYLQPMNMIPAGQTLPGIQRTGRGRPETRASAPAEQHPAWVGRMADLLAGYFQEQREQLVVDGDQLPDRSEWDGHLAALLAGLFTDVVAETARESAAELGGAFNPSLVRNWVAASAARVARNINLTTFDRIETALADAEDETNPQQLVDGVLDNRTNREAALIASGVVNSVGSFGRTEGARQAGAGAKTWAAEHESHSGMGGETVGIDESFSNGTKYPCDPAGGASQVAGCSCGITFSLGR